jgi:hypothetical protein
LNSKPITDPHNTIEYSYSGHQIEKFKVDWWCGLEERKKIEAIFI